MVVEKALFRGLLHINAARKVAAVHLATFLLDISVFLSSSYVSKVHPYRWKFLEGHLSHLGTCLTEIRPIQEG